MKSILILASLATAVMAQPGLAQATGPQWETVVENFMQADENDDGLLSIAEFTTLIDLNAADGRSGAAMVKRMGRQSVAFKRIDADADGLLSADELSAMAKRFQR